MKILITHELFKPDFAGGGETLVYKMAKHLLQRGIEVKVLTTGDPKIKEFEGISTIRLPINRYMMNFAFLRILKEARWADIIQTCTYNACFPSWLTGKLLGKPVICMVMSCWGKQWLKMRGLVRGTISRTVEKFQINRSYNKIIFLSEHSKKWGIDVGICKKRIEVISPGIDLKKCEPEKKEPFVLFSGRFARQKGVYDLLKVARLLPTINFVMRGRGEEEEKLKKIAPKNIKFLPFATGKSYFELYSKASVFFLPSYGETFGFVLVEAMASGCPIVSTIPIECKGFIVKQGNVRQMAKSIEYLMKNPEKAQAMGKENVKLAKEYTWEKFANKLIQIYKELLD